MAINNIPSNLGNLVAPFLPSGLRPVGQEFAENRNSTFRPVEQTAKTAESRVQLQYRQENEEQNAGGHAGDRRKAEKRAEAEEAEGDGVEAEGTAKECTGREAPDTPGSRLAQRFAGSTGTTNRTGRNFDELV